MQLRHLTFSFDVVLIATLLSLFGGCALPSRPMTAGTEKELLAPVDQLSANHEYRRALLYLDNSGLDRESEAYKEKHDRLMQLSEDFAAETEKQASEQAADDNLVGALTTVDLALNKLPPNQGLIDFKEKLLKEREKKRAAIERRLLLSKASDISTQLEGYRELARLRKPSWLERLRFDLRTDSLTYMRGDLLACGRQALAERELDVAKGCLWLAGEVSTSPELEQLLARLDEMTPRHPERADEETKKSQTASPTEEGQAPLSETKKFKPGQFPVAAVKLIAKLQGELDQDEIAEGYATLARLEKVPQIAESARTYRERLDQAKERLIAKYLENGNRYYRGGQIAQAREVWLKVLDLDPANHTALEKIARAERVLKKIQALREQQQSSTSNK